MKKYYPKYQLEQFKRTLQDHLHQSAGYELNPLKLFIFSNKQEELKEEIIEFFNINDI